VKAQLFPVVVVGEKRGMCYRESMRKHLAVIVVLFVLVSSLHAGITLVEPTQSPRSYWFGVEAMYNPLYVKTEYFPYVWNAAALLGLNNTNYWDVYAQVGAGQTISGTSIDLNALVMVRWFPFTGWDLEGGAGFVYGIDGSVTNAIFRISQGFNFALSDRPDRPALRFGIPIQFLVPSQIFTLGVSARMMF